jgi:hypothetical protein
VGCDIHGMIERAERGTYSTRDAWCRWRAAGEVDVGRDYELFAALAGVRNYVGLVPICAPKGLPGYGGLEEDSLGGYHRWDAANDEPNDYFQAYYERWHVDAHSASWLTLAELRAYDATQEVDDPDVVVARDGDGRVLAKAGWSASGGERVGKRRLFVWPGDEGKPTSWDRLLADVERAKREGDTDEDVRIVFFFDT